MDRIYLSKNFKICHQNLNSAIEKVKGAEQTHKKHYNYYYICYHTACILSSICCICIFSEKTMFLLCYVSELILIALISS